MSFIDLTSPAYSELAQFGILSRNALTSTGVITVNSGYWYGATGSYDSLAEGIPPSGLNNTISSSALSQLNDLIDNIDVVTGTFDTLSIGSGGDDAIFSPGINYVGTNISYTGKKITFDAAGNSDAQFFITSTSYITFVTTTFEFINDALPSNIFWLADQGAAGAFTATNSSVPGIIITSADIEITSSSAENISFTGHIYSNGSATLTRSGAGPLTVNCDSSGPEPVVCYLKGSLILTDKGFIPIENIKSGDKVVTKGRILKNKYFDVNSVLQTRPVVWISKYKIKYLSSKSAPICIKKDAFEKECPFEDLYVSPNHRLLLNGDMVLAKNIVNGKTIYQSREFQNVEYYHLECQHHSAIFANGVLSESYVDVDNRHIFENKLNPRNKICLKKR